MGQGRISGWRLFLFSTPAIPLAAMLLPVSIYLPNYYATELGVSLTSLAWASAVVRLFDLWLDPAIGLSMDKTSTRFGRFRPWFVAGVPLAIVAVWMLFMARPGVDATYFLIWMVVGFLGQSIGQLAHVAWAAAVAPAYDQRSRVYGWFQFLTVLGLISILMVPPLMQKFVHASYAASVQAMGWFAIISLPICMGLALMAVPEPAVKPPAAPPRLSQYWGLLKRPSVLRVLGADVAWGTALAIGAVLFLFYFDAVKGYDRATASLLLAGYFVGALVGAPLWTFIGRRFGKHRGLMAATLSYSVGLLLLLLIPRGPLFVVMIVIAGMPFSAGAILLKAMMADVADEVRLESGVDRAGLLFSLLTGSIKIGSTLAVFVSLQALPLFGFDAKLGTKNGPEALLALNVLFVAVPIVLCVLAALAIRKYGLDAEAHAHVRRQLDERDALAGFSDQIADGKL